MNNKTTVKSYIACILTYVIFGFSFIFSKKALYYASPFMLMAVRFIVALAVMSLALLVSGRKISLKGKPVWKLCLLGLIQPVMYFIFETYGIQKTSSAFAGLMLGLLPVAGLISGAIFLKEKIRPLQIICVILSVGGVTLTTIGGEVSASLVGTLLLVGAVVSASLFSVLSRSISEVFTPFERTYVMFLVGTVVFVPAAIIENGSHIGSRLISAMNFDFFAGVVYLAIISSVGGFLLLNYALNNISVGNQTLISNSCTVVSVLAGIFIMGDRFNIWQIIGIVVVIISVCGISFSGKINEEKHR